MGYSTLKTCTLDIASYLDAETAPLQKFYDLYLVDADGALVPTVTKLIEACDHRFERPATPTVLRYESLNRLEGFKRAPDDPRIASSG